MPAAVRKGDKCVPHCSPFSIAAGSNNVLVNGLPMSRVGDSVTSHLIKQGKKCVTHTPTIQSGSSSVYVNGQPAAFVGSAIGPQCTSVSSGSSDVFIGQ